MTEISLRKISAGVLGAGHFVQSILLPNIIKTEAFEVKSLCSSNLASAQTLADQYKIDNVSSNWKEFVTSTHFEAIFFAVPPYIQEEVLSEIIGKKHILAEKPFSSSLHSAIVIAQKARNYKTISMVDFCFPELETWKILKSIIDQERLGDLQQVIVHWSFENYVNKNFSTSWKSDPCLGGGTLYNFMSHVFYYLEWFIGPIVKLNANLSKTPEDIRETDTLNCITLEFDNGVVCNVVINAKAWQGQGHKIEFYGKKGTAILKNETKNYMKGFELLVYDKFSEQQRKFNDFEIDESQPNYEMIKKFSQAILHNKVTKPDFEDGLRVQILIDCAIKSNINGKWICVP